MAMYFILSDLLAKASFRDEDTEMKIPEPSLGLPLEPKPLKPTDCFANQILIKCPTSTPKSQRHWVDKLDVLEICKKNLYGSKNDLILALVRSTKS